MFPTLMFFKIGEFPGYGKELSDVVDDEINGDLNKLLVELIKVMYLYLRFVVLLWA